MKKIIFIFAFLFIPLSLFSQVVKEEIILKSEEDSINIYNFIYNEETKTYIYLNYDESGKYYITSNKGNSRRYDYLSTYDAKFDKKGNYYIIGYKNDQMTNKSTYYFLINGVENGEFDFINYPLSQYEEMIYFVAQKDSLYLLVGYDTEKNRFTYGKQYTNIYLPKIDEKYIWEPYYELGITKKGEPYYVADDGKNVFLVIGNKEQQKHKGIRDYTTYEDLKGNICYNAIDAEGENQYGYLVQGKKIYKSFKATLNPIIFKPDNTPVYKGSNDEYNEFYSQFIIEGETPGKIYNGYIYDITLTPNGKIAYIATDSTKDGEYYSRIVIDGKENKKYEYVNNLKFLKDDIPVYSAKKDNQEILVIGNKENYYNYSSILNITISPKGEVAILGYKYPDDNSNDVIEYYVHIGDKKYGPYVNYPYSYMEGSQDFIFFNEKGNFAFIIINDNDEYNIISDYFKSDDYNSVWLLDSYKNDFYYLANKRTTGDKDSYCVYKNGKKVSDSYDDISNYTLDKEKGTLTFLGLKENTAYYVKIKL